MPRLGQQLKVKTSLFLRTGLVAARMKSSLPWQGEANGQTERYTHFILLARRAAQRGERAVLVGRMMSPGCKKPRPRGERRKETERERQRRVQTGERDKFSLACNSPYEELVETRKLHAKGSKYRGWVQFARTTKRFPDQVCMRYLARSTYLQCPTLRCVSVCRPINPAMDPRGVTQSPSIRFNRAESSTTYLP
ncbi:hypothetical protein VTK56DRAFT_3920 [Thermocarpiscus australiensis]